MSVSRVKYIKQYVPVSSYTYDSGNSVVSITTASNHLLFTGVPIFLTSDKQYSAYNTVATVISSNTITAPVTAVNYILQKNPAAFIFKLYSRINPCWFIWISTNTNWHTRSTNFTKRNRNTICCSIVCKWSGWRSIWY